MPSEKKRKRNSIPGDVASDIAVTTVSSGDFPPILATTHGITLPPSLSLQSYTHITPATAGSKSTKRHQRAEYLLHGSTPQIDYEGRECPEDSDYHRYYIGIFDPATNSVELHVAPKVHFSRTIKRHAERDSAIDSHGVVLNKADSRAVLGRQFGTRKAQKALLNRELNRIDVTDMDSTVTTSIMSQVGEATRCIPTTAELGAQLLDARPIPPPNKDATRPEDVYDLADVIGTDEWAALWVREWEQGEFGGIRSTFVRTRVTRLHTAKEQGATVPGAYSKSLKILKYVAHLIEFYQFQFQARGKLPAMERAKKALGVDQVLVENLYTRFADKASSGDSSGVDRWAVSPALANKCLYYLAVLCLIVDSWEVDMYELRVDLGLTARELTMAFKAVGCSIKEISKTQCMTLKMTKAEAAQHKRAVLKIPLEFPSAPRRKAAQRGRM